MPGPFNGNDAKVRPIKQKSSIFLRSGSTLKFSYRKYLHFLPLFCALQWENILHVKWRCPKEILNILNTLVEMPQRITRTNVGMPQMEGKASKGNKKLRSTHIFVWIYVAPVCFTKGFITTRPFLDTGLWNASIINLTCCWKRLPAHFPHRYKS